MIEIFNLLPSCKLIFICTIAISMQTLPTYLHMYCRCALTLHFVSFISSSLRIINIRNMYYIFRVNWNKADQKYLRQFVETTYTGKTHLKKILLLSWNSKDQNGLRWCETTYKESTSLSINRRSNLLGHMKSLRFTKTK